MNIASGSESAAHAAIDSGLPALCGIASYYRIASDPFELRRQLSLGEKPVDFADLVRAAQLIGLKARLTAHLAKERLAALPAPTLLRLRDGGFNVFGGKTPKGLYRIVDPLSRQARELSLDDLYSTRC